jgi:hypothetical protein
MLGAKSGALSGASCTIREVDYDSRGANFKQASRALLTSACKTSSAVPSKPAIKWVLIVAILFNFMTELCFKPVSSKEGVPLVIKTSQMEEIMGVLVDM